MTRDRQIDDRDAAAIREQAAYTIAERGDFVGQQASVVADVLADGELPGYDDVEALREALDAISAELGRLDELRNANVAVADGGARSKIET
jgi:hypothetical protein